MTKTKDYKNSNLNPLKIKFAGKIPAKNQSKRVAQWQTKMKIQDSGYISHGIWHPVYKWQGKNEHS